MQPVHAPSLGGSGVYDYVANGVAEGYDIMGQVIIQATAVTQTGLPDFAPLQPVLVAAVNPQFPFLTRAQPASFSSSFALSSSLQ